MALEVELPSSFNEGLPLREIIGFSVQEDATPIEPSSSAGGSGQITFSTTTFDEAERLTGSIVLSDETLGRVSGRLTSIEYTDENLSVTADSVLALFNTEKTVSAFVGTFSEAMQYYAALVGITNDLAIDISIADRAVIYPGWVGNVWVGIKQLLVKEQVEMAMVLEHVVVRPLRLLTATLDTATQESWSITRGNSAKAVEINYYNHAYGTQLEVYPVITEGDVTPTILQVDAGETAVFTETVNASMLAVNQPVMQEWVDNQSYAGTNGVYSVVGNDGLPITAAQWAAQGGSLSVRITDDPSVIEITVVGASMVDFAPYRIAMSSGSGTYYNSLHITGEAVAWEKKLVTIPTGATSTTTSDEVLTTIDNPFINTLEEAYSLGMKAAGAASGLQYVLSGAALSLNRSNTGGVRVAPTISDFNSATPEGTLISAFNTVWSGQDIADFNVYWLSTTENVFANQLFGNVVGSRVLKENANFRIDSASVGPDATRYSASLDTTIGDFNARWITGDVSIAAFNDIFAGYTCRDFSIKPLRKIAV